MRLPEDFVRETREAMGERLFGLLHDGLEQEPPPVSIRVHSSSSLGEQNATSAGRVVDGEPVPWCANGYYLSGRPGFTFDPLLHAGCYYVQEASSMFLDHVVSQIKHLLPCRAGGQEPSLRALDLCAAPGGKSTLLASALPEGSRLISNEAIAKRAWILSENMQKWYLTGGAPVVTNNFACDFKKAKLMFDLILCDVPCSGEGMFRKNEKAVGEWSLANVKKCQQLQREIVADIWPCLQPGGYMVYSTCTFNVHENEENVAWIANELGAEVIEIPVEPEWNITGALTGRHPVCRFIPGVSRGEGLFMALLKKKGDESARIAERKGAMNQLRVVPNEFLDTCRAAIESGDSASLVSLSYEQAIAYLRGEALVLPAETPRGIVPVGFKNRLLGVVKNIGNRANNLYPKEWRIKSTYVPEYQEIIKEI